MSLNNHRRLIKEVCEQENQSITINKYNDLLGNEHCHTRNISRAYIISPHKCSPHQTLELKNTFGIAF